ncbi:hypothetical protein HGRIS_001616 [Hohenbuehelia grisea]|uniref:G-alpha-domain-containing protein n=1 Tax=Hohenbuehelia grisea TaxID=104357 RepID=A0ABR3JHY0_9AGAR
MGGRNNDYDPFTLVLAPPPGETAEEKAARETKEADAKRVSDAIDDSIRRDRAALKKQKTVLRVLLLGQAESGKSTTLKNFRLKYARSQWLQERASWRGVIQLNLVRSVMTILDAVQAEINGDPLPINPADADRDDDTISVSTHQATDNGGMTSSPPTTTRSDKYRLLNLRLSPLRRVYASLKRRLGAASDEVREGVPETMVATPFDLNPVPVLNKRRINEDYVRNWFDALSGSQPSSPTSSSARSHLSSPQDADEATDVIAGCKDDIAALWHDPEVQAVLARRGVKVQDHASYFLNDIDRIASRTYEPSDDDVVRARLRTVGVQEHRIQFEQRAMPSFSIGHEFGREWAIYDVGGARTVRQAWLPYFDNVNAIIFLAPVSCFDERLDEDTSINRLEDSFILWRAVVSTKLLQKATMIVFLNKCDLLKRKLRSGVQVRKHLPSFGDRPNDAATVVKYLRDKFKDTLKQYSPEPRIGYLYPTSVTDTKATSTTLKTVRDGILREHLKNADLV